MNTVVKEQQINLNGFTIRYFTAGEDGLPLVLLHGNAASAIDWSWVLPRLANQYRVYAPDFPGFGDSSKPNLNYSLDFLTQFVSDFLNALNIEKAVLAGNSLGGIVALRFALSNSDRVASLVLVDSSGLGYAVTPLLSQLTLPGYGEIMIAGCKTPLGAKPRSWLRATLLFTHPGKVPAIWIAEQERMSLLPGFLEASLSALRAQLNFIGQREVLLDTLNQLTIPTLVVWGTNDSVFPKYQAETAVSRLQRGQLALIPDCGHLPHVERPDLFSNAVNQFLVEVK
ncbi:alpha/beta fold hydrolase [Gloeocapsopsis sp. IPPAS B-1203]|uniref:alpha/beta fold hydrolase n=1 Tax=Gloeocapsopsis sp. IPPAS B-1203 TaxID=2049454 RepID=UPI000C1787D1|nr:alpha/beta fold hydrolase [Gloeocapsopsis sp. IPPAS B-1203]PIG92208.1 alpha/beta hydrolase [Gloeocapsopsis sp. IPPAS B-1203]